MPSTEPAVLDDASLLEAWERTSRLARPWREIELLAAASDQTANELARLPIGERDRLILALRARTFGSRFDCETVCTACGERLELTVDIRDLALASPADIGSELLLEDGSYVARCRQPDSVDIAACSGMANPGEALLGRCAHVADRSGAPIEPADWPLSVRRAVDAHLAILDPCAEILLDVACPACACTWQSVLDPAAFLLREVDTRARQLLDEVHMLARAYGWSEAAILAMGPSRRSRYLELVLQ
jgi:hypothetical protein